MVVFLICQIMFRTEKVTLVEGKNINEDKWSALLAFASVDQKLFSAKWFLDIVHPDWCAYIDGDYESALVLPKKKRWGISYLVQPLFCQKFSILHNRPTLSTEDISIETYSNLISWTGKNFLKVHFCLGFLPQPSDKFIIKERTNCKLKLDSGFRNAYSSQIKRHLKQAQNFSFHSSFSDSPKELIQLFNENNNKENSYYGRSEMLILEKVIFEGIRSKRMLLQEVRNNSGELLSGAVWFLAGNDSIFFFSARKSDTSEKGFFSWMIDHFIETQLKGLGVLDFEGSDNEGLKRYYLGFGSEVEKYYEIIKK